MRSALAALLLAASATAAQACTQYPATYSPREWRGKEVLYGYYQNRLLERPYHTLVMGDSIARRWPYELVEALWGGSVLNVGIGGSTVLDLNWELSNWPVEHQAPAVVFVSIGSNDIGKGYCPSTAARGVVDLLVRLKTVYPNARVVWQTMLRRGRHGLEFRNEIAAVNAFVIAQSAGRYEVYDAATPIIEACRGQAECSLYSDLWHPYLNGYEVIYRDARIVP